MKGINPGIRRAVELLNNLGYATCDSGDGETHDHPCDRENGYVVVKLPRASQATAFRHTDEIWHQLFDACTPEGREHITVTLTYSPIDGLTLIDISPITDKDLKPT